jgi:allantoin racemase
MNDTSGQLRLAYQSFGQVAGMEPYQARLDALVRAAASDHEVEILRLPATVVAGKGFASAQAMDVPAILRLIDAAVDRGVDAIAVGNGFDPGLWEARELFDVPVLGMFESVAYRGLRVGWRLGVVTSGASGAGRIEELAARYGIGDRIVRPAAAGVPVPTIMAAFEDPALGAHVVGETGRAMRELAGRGADVAMVASGALDVFLESIGRPDVGLPVLPSVTVLVHELVAAARMARAGVPFVSRAGRFASPPPQIRASLRAEGS